MKNVKTKKVLSSILSSCLILMLLFSTMIISPAAFTANALDKYDLEINHIFVDGDKADDSYNETVGQYAAGDTPMVAIEAPYGYIISEVYFTSAAGADFVEYVEDLDYRNPISGVYHITMPASALTVNVVYDNILNSVVVNHIYDGGAADDQDYQVTVNDHQETGTTVVFNSDVKPDYKVGEIYVAGYTAAGAFEEILPAPVDHGTGTYSLEMPDQPIVITFVYVTALNPITPRCIFEGPEVPGDHYQGPVDAVAGEVVHFSGEQIPDYKLTEAYVTVGAGDDFVEVLPVDVLAGSYSFVMPDEEVFVHLVYEAQRFTITSQNIFTDDTQDDTVYYEGVESALVGEKVYFAVNAPEGYAVSEVYATQETGSDFVTSVPVDTLAGAYCFDMPAGNVTISVVFKPTLFNAEYYIYLGDELSDVFTVEGVPVGERYVFTPPEIRNMKVDLVTATRSTGGVFSEVIPMEEIGNAFCFDMPEDDVKISIFYKSTEFKVNLHTRMGEELTDEFVDFANTGDKFVIEIEDYVGYTMTASATSGNDDVPLTREGPTVYSFIMPEGDVDITAVYELNVYDIEINNLDEKGNIMNTEYISDFPAGETFFHEFTLSDDYDSSKFVPSEVYVTVDAAPFEEVYHDYETSRDLISLVMPEQNLKITVVWQQQVFDLVERYIYNNEVHTQPTRSFRVGEMCSSTFSGVDGYELSEVYVTAQDGAFSENIDYCFVSENTINFVGAVGDTHVDYFLEPVECEVRYYSYSGAEYVLVGVETVGYEETASFGLDNTPAALPDGHAFVAWYNGEEPYDFDTPVTEDLSLVAVYDFDTFTVSFNSDGGSAVPSQKVLKGAAAVKPAAPEKEGFDFIGWQNADVDYDFAAPVTADVELTAKWEPKTYVVNVPTGEGYTITPTADSVNPVVYDGTFKFNVAYENGVETADVVITANGEPLTADNEGLYTISGIRSDIYIAVSGVGMSWTHTVTFHYYSKGAEVTVAQTVVHAGTVTPPTETYRYTYKFLGWFDNAAGDGVAVTDFTNVTDDAEYFAVYEENPVADYEFGTHTLTPSEYGEGFVQLDIEVIKDNAEYKDHVVYVLVAAQLLDGTTVFFYVPVSIANGEVTQTVSFVLNSNTFDYIDVYLVYDVVDFTGPLDWVDFESAIQL